MREAIKDRGLSAYAVAQAAGLDPTIVGRWMTRRRDVTLTSADAIAGALGLRLVDGRRKPQPADVFPEPPTDPA